MEFRVEHEKKEIMIQDLKDELSKKKEKRKEFESQIKIIEDDRQKVCIYSIYNSFLRNINFLTTIII